MRALRPILAILFAFVGVSALLNCFVLARQHYFRLTDATGAFRPLLLVAAAFLPVIASLFLVAAVSYWRKWRSGRAWNLLLGVANLLVPFLLAYFFWRHGYGSISSNLIANGLLLGLGAVILLAFWRWDPVAEKKTHDPAAIAARPGDGTFSLLNRFHLFADAVLFWIIYSAWARWAWNLGLPHPGLVKGILLLTLTGLLAVTLHELGHTLCGLSLGQKLIAFLAGPFQWRFSAGRWRFRFDPLGLLTTGGGAATVPRRLGEPAWRDLAMIAAGPLASLLAGIVGLWAALNVIDTPGENLWFLIAMFGSIALKDAIVNLVPLRTAAGYSDGARILQLLRGGVWAELDRAFRTCAATTVTPLRPRDYDIDALHRIIDTGIVSGPQLFLLHLLAHAYYLDHGASREALNEIIRAEALYDNCAAKIPAEFHFSLVIEEAITRRDAAWARHWWDLMEAKKLTQLNGDYWMARSALCWIEGKHDESLAAWGKAHDYLRTMPQTGTYAFDRDCLAILKRTIESELPAEVRTVSMLLEEPVLVG